MPNTPQGHDELVRMTEAMKHLSEDLADFKADLKELDKKYASKWVETVMVSLIGLILMSVFGALIGLIISKPNTAIMMDYHISRLVK